MWEPDFNKGPSFWDPPTSRCNWTLYRDARTLAIRSGDDVVGIDTMSDVSLGLRSSLTNLRWCLPLELQVLGGTASLDQTGDFHLRHSEGVHELIRVYAVPASSLPPRHQAVLGMPEIRRLGIFLDSLMLQKKSTPVPASAFDKLLPPVNVVPTKPRIPAAVASKWQFHKSTDGDGLPPSEYSVFSDSDDDDDEHEDYPSALARYLAEDREHVHEPVVSAHGSFQFRGSLHNDSSSEEELVPDSPTSSPESAVPESLPHDEPLAHPDPLPAPTEPVEEPTSWWFRALTFILFSLAFAALWTSRWANSRQALLPGSGGGGGHSLFAPPPHATFHSIVFVPQLLPTCPVASFPFDNYAYEYDLGDGLPPSSFRACDPSVNVCFMLDLPSSFEGGKALRATSKVLPRGQHVAVEIQVGVDTLSDATFALREVLHDVHDIAPEGIRNAASTVPFHEEGILHVLVDGEYIHIPALVATPSQLPSRTQALYGMPAITELGISLDQQIVKQGAPLICYLGEKKLREWWDSHEGESADTRPFDVDSIDINPALPASILTRVRAIIKKHAVVFEGAANTLPKAFDLDPIELKFIPNAQPKSVPEPRWSYAYGQIVRKWAEDGIKNGSLEWSSSAWASRPHIVLKPPNGETAASAKIEDCKLNLYSLSESGGVVEIVGWGFCVDDGSLKMQFGRKGVTGSDTEENFERGDPPKRLMYGGVTCEACSRCKLWPLTVMVVVEDSHATIPEAPEHLDGAVCLRVVPQGRSAVRVGSISD